MKRAAALLAITAVVLTTARITPARVTLPPADDAAIAHALSRLTFGARPGDLERVKAEGLASWIERQLDAGRLDDRTAEQALAALPALTLSIAELQKQYPRPDKDLRGYPAANRPIRIVGEMQAARMVRAVEGERQLQEVMVDFWFNHFNVHGAKGEVKWYLPAYERDVIRPHALGRFPAMLRATARHPAMLFYLDNWLSTRADFVVPAGPNRGRRAGLNENYARELMELHTLGVDGGYTQKDVTEVARAFTGWSIERPREDAHFVFRRATHDRGDKMVLGMRLAAGGGQDDGERVLDLLVRHPSTARFIATKLVRRFVSDTPPPQLVERVASTFSATDGDVRAMLKTIVASPEFWDADARRAKIKKPFEFVASAVRAVGGHVDARGGFALARAATGMGEGLYAAQPPTGYPDRAEAWVNAGALLARMNFALALTQNRVPGVILDLTPVSTERVSPEATLQRLLDVILQGGATTETRAVLAAQLTNPEIRRQTLDDRGPADTDVAKLAALVLGSPEFQRR